MNAKNKITSFMIVFSLLFSVLFANISTEVYAKDNTLLESKQGEKVTYVSQADTGNASGHNIENTKEFVKAIEAAKEGDTFILVGKVELPEQWHTPKCAITIKGYDKNSSELVLQKGTINGGGSVSLSLEGDLTLDNLLLNVVSNNYYPSMFVVIANGHRLVLGEGVYTPSDTSKYTGYIFGGGFHEDINSNTYIESHATISATNIYGGGCGGSVNGNIHIEITNQAFNIIGGGLTPYNSSKNANVNGDVFVNIHDARIVSKADIFAGGDAKNLDANILGNVTLNYINIEDKGKEIYGAGKASIKGSANVEGNVKIVVKNYNMANNISKIFGAGKGDSATNTANVKGNVDITYADGNMGSVYGAGNQYANVGGNTNIHIENVDGDVKVYGGGKGSNAHKVESMGNVDISILNTRVQLFTQGVNAKVHGLVKVKLFGGGADRNSDFVDSNLYNRMRKSDSDAKKGITSPEFKAVVEVLQGTSTITTINDFENINIKDGTLCEHVRDYHGSGTVGDDPRELFNNIGNVTIEKGGCLDLLGDNKIKGNFVSSGNLTTVAGSKLIVDGYVSSYQGASYTSSNADESYLNSYPFLQTKKDVSPIAEFESTDSNYFVSHRTDCLDESIVREWYLNKNIKPIINANDITLTQGDYYDPFKDVTALDKEDGDLTNKIKVVKNTVDTQKIGQYEVVYSVTDNYGETTTKLIYVTVNPPIALINHAPRIEAQDIVILKGDIFNPLENVKATDYEDGDITKKLEIIENTVDTTKAGIYKVIYLVKDSVGASVTHTIKVTVNNPIVELNQVPIIEAKDVTLNKGNSFNPLDNVIAKDKEDGDLTDKIKVVKNTVDITKIGTYEVTYQVRDSQGAIATRTIKVIVKDTNKTPITNDISNVGLYSIIMIGSILVLSKNIRKKEI